MTVALVAVDIQYDFLPGGALAVADGHEVIPVIQRLASARERFGVVVATQDWHPKDHGSFASSHPGAKAGELVDLFGLRQVLWPDHCVQGSLGAELHRDLEREAFDAVVRKGTDPRIDSYSVFFDNGHRKATGLEDLLRRHGVGDVFLAGLATDYCVLWSARDAVALGFRTHVVVDGCRGIDLSPGDVQRAFDEMRSLGVELVASADILRPEPSSV